jgi:bacterioferritin (cytochrome b1)
MAKGDDKDPLDVEGAVRQLNVALSGQYRSVLQYTLAAAAVTGFEHVGLADRLKAFAAAELEDARSLAEKIVTLGGEPTTTVGELKHHADAAEAFDWLIETEAETIEALQDTIPHTGHTGDSEALEHRLEHVIMRKQEQVDFLIRARGGDR